MVCSKKWLISVLFTHIEGLLEKIMNDKLISQMMKRAKIEAYLLRHRFSSYYGY